jgi:thiol-disulfide isomerase/thioredoxin
MPDLIGRLEAGFRAKGSFDVPLEVVPNDDPLLSDIPIDRDARVREAVVKLPHLVKLRQGGEMAVLLVDRPGGATTVYADVNLDKQLSASERFAPSLAVDQRFSGQAVLKVQLPGPPAGLFGVIVQVPGPIPTQPPPAEALSVAFGAVILGSVQVDSRPIRVELPFDVVNAAIETRSDYLGIDGNADGRIDHDSLSPEYAYARDEDVVFRVGRRYVSVKEADLTTRRLVLRQHPASDYQRIELAMGSELPDFSFVDLDGRTHRLSDLRGKFVLVSYWSTTCGWAVSEIPFLNDLYEKHRPHGLEIVGLMDDDQPTQAREFVEKNRVKWPNAVVPDLVQKRFRFFETPTLLLLDRHGRIISRGRKGEPPLRGAELGATLDRLLATKAK